MIFSAFLVHGGLPTRLSEWITGLPLHPRLIVVMVLLLYIPMGMLMDALPMVLLTMPIVFPIVINLGFDPVWFGVLVVVMSEMALISPPVGLNAYVVQGVCNVPLEEVFRGVIPFILVMAICIAILIAFPQISLFLPSMMK